MQYLHFLFKSSSAHNPIDSLAWQREIAKDNTDSLCHTETTWHCPFLPGCSRYHTQGRHRHRHEKDTDTLNTVTLSIVPSDIFARKRHYADKETDKDTDTDIKRPWNCPLLSHQNNFNFHFFNQEFWSDSEWSSSMLRPKVITTNLFHQPISFLWRLQQCNDEWDIGFHQKNWEYKRYSSLRI